MNVEYTLEVTDTLTGAVRTYFNPLGISSPAITDIDAFESCGDPAGLSGFANMHDSRWLQVLQSPWMPLAEASYAFAR